MRSSLARGIGGALRHLPQRFVERADVLRDALIERCARSRQRNRARRAVQKLGADLLLELGDRAAHAARADAELAHAQMAHSPAVLAGYTSLRAVITEHGTFDPKVGAALTLATAATVGNGYMVGIATRLAQMSGLAEEQIAALRTGIPTSNAKIDVLTDLVREATANSGNVTDATWRAAQQAGWSDQQLTDAFAYLALTVFTGYFLNYAQTEMDALWQLKLS